MSAARSRRSVTLPRSAWVEVDLAALAQNFRLLRAELPAPTRLLYVVKDDAYGLGAVRASQVALANGADQLAVFTLGEAAELRDAGVRAPILLLGERLPDELPWVLELGLETCVGRVEIAQHLAELGRQRSRPVPVHLKINTGMNRFGLPWRRAADWSRDLAALEGLEFVGALSHFAQSDELEKSFANTQRVRFEDCVATLRSAGVRPQLLHHCNSGGFLDLPEAHFDIVRVGLLAQGVFPSSVCRRLPGLRPVMAVKARIVAVQELESGDTVGYGMRWRAERPSRIGVLSLGYGDGFPRVRNEGSVLVRGRRVPIVGGITMDALMIDLTDVPAAEVGDETVLMGRQGDAEITAHDIAALKRSVSYDVLTGWRARLPRVYLGP
ncbi:MAG TPA: alanine racemase [Candidatus Limnocylindria bacterium]|jgi:alanine racemase|nr:alanine racemase [Candidatus Limnocylindria bacterium]